MFDVSGFNSRVSILILLDVVLEACFADLKNGSSEVSILILLDVVLEVWSLISST